MSAQINTALNAIIGNLLTAKSVKTGFGHDRAGVMCNVYLGSKKAYEFHDDGWGGEHEIAWANADMKNAIDALINEHNIAQVLHDNGCEFYGAPSDISHHDMYMYIAEALVNKVEQEKNRAKIIKRCEGNLVVTTPNGYRESGWKGIKNLTDLLRYKNGTAILQQAYDNVKASLKQGEQIANPTEQLKSLGITL